MNDYNSKKKRILNLCVHFKNICEIAQVMGSMHFQNPTKSLKDVTSQKRFHYIAILSSQGWVGRGAQAKWWGWTGPMTWQSTELWLPMLKNAEQC